VRGRRGNAVDRHAGEETAGLDRGIGIVEKLAVYGQFRAEDLIDLHHIFPEIENICERGYVGKGTGGSAGIG
jgi:hypothetical protein